MKSSFIVSPMIQKISLKAGETYTGSVTVANPMDSTEDFYFKATISPYSVTGEDYTPDFKTMSDWSMITEWITLDATEGKLAPNESVKLHFEIKVPETAPAGGQYAMIGISSNSSIASGNQDAVQDEYEMASLLFADVEGEIKHDGKIVENKISDFVLTGKPFVSTKLTNEGNVHETANIEISVKNYLTGETIYPKEGENNETESLIMPQTTRVIYRDLGSMPPLGVFEVTESVSYMGEGLLTSTVMVICPIWFIALVAGIFTFVITSIFCIHHSRRKKQLHFE